MKYITLLCILFIVFGCKKKEDDIIEPSNNITNIVVEPAQASKTPAHAYMIDAILNGDTIQQDYYNDSTTLFGGATMYQFSVNDNDRSIVQFAINDTAVTKSYLGAFEDEFKACFILEKNGSMYGFCAFAQNNIIKHDVNVTEIRNDSIWATFDIQITGSPAYDIDFVETLNGLPYR